MEPYIPPKRRAVLGLAALCAAVVALFLLLLFQQRRMGYNGRTVYIYYNQQCLFPGQILRLFPADDLTGILFFLHYAFIERIDGWMRFVHNNTHRLVKRSNRMSHADRSAKAVQIRIGMSHNQHPLCVRHQLPHCVCDQSGPDPCGFFHSAGFSTIEHGIFPIF